MLSFEVLHSSWNEYGGGIHNIEDASPELHALVSHAEAAGAVRVIEGGDPSGIQSQEDGEATYAAAQEAGLWQEGHQINVALDAIAAGKESVELGSESPAAREIVDARELLSSLGHEAPEDPEEVS